MRKKGETLQQTLVSDKKYKGKYVALKSFAENVVVASGKNPSEVMARANKKGVKEPVLVFVPEKPAVHIY